MGYLQGNIPRWQSCNPRVGKAGPGEAPGLEPEYANPEGPGWKLPCSDQEPLTPTIKNRDVTTEGLLSSQWPVHWFLDVQVSDLQAGQGDKPFSSESGFGMTLRKKEMRKFKNSQKQFQKFSKTE